MIIDKKTLDLYDLADNLILDFNLEDAVFFDIETTGLSRTKHMIYLLGCLYCENNIWHSVQWLATCLEDEKKLISYFFDILKNKNFIIHFNGNSFDIPFINAKAKKYNISSPLGLASDIKYIDLYKVSKQFSIFLNLPNYKLVTLENALNIKRKDTFSGKELIKTYYDFIKIYALDDLKKDYTNSNKLCKDLLLHNYEDIVNLPFLMNLYKYNLLKNGYISNITLKESLNVLTITGELLYNNISYSLPININYVSNNNFAPITINSSNNTIKLEIPILECELKFFYDNYKEYYYLPLEDTAIHKSIGQYVDKNHRQQAQASNCYIKKSSKFIPIVSKIDLPIFKSDYSSKESYIELNSNLLNEYLSSYISNIFNSI